MFDANDTLASCKSQITITQNAGKHYFWTSFSLDILFIGKLIVVSFNFVEDLMKILGDIEQSSCDLKSVLFRFLT